MRGVVIALVAIVALFSTVKAADTPVSGSSCTGLNMTTNNIGFTSMQCPYGYIMDTFQAQCVTYRQAVNNYIQAPCVSDSECGPLATVPGLSSQILGCGYQSVNSPTGVCTWVGTRAQNDSCVSNINCYGYTNTTVGATGKVIHGCDKVTKTCRPQTKVYTALGGDRCNYEDGANYVMCSQPSFVCSTAVGATPAGNCKQLYDFGQLCNTAGSPGCRIDGICFGPSGNVNNTCQPLRTQGQNCYFSGNAGECSQATTPLVCVGPGVPAYNYTCQPYLGLYQNCSSSNPSAPWLQCGANLKCLNNGGVNQCIPPAYSNESCITGNTCAPGLKCISSVGKCFFGNITDPCALTPSVPFRDTCQPGLVCLTSPGTTQLTCQAQVGVGQNCTASNALCLSGLVCSNNTCVAPQTLGQPCDPVAYMGKFTTLQCNSTLQCSRGVCISPYSLPLNSLCSQDSDCDTAYCDRMMMRCTRRRMCSSSFTDTSVSCTCVCNAGNDNPGQCIMNNCNKQAWALLNCTNPLYYDLYANSTSYVIASSLPATTAWLDSASSFYSKCSSQHANWVNCQATMWKWGAPSVGLGDLINYNLAAVSASSTVSVSIMVMVATIMSLFMLL